MWLLTDGKNYWKGFNPHGLPMCGIGKKNSVEFKTKKLATDARFGIPVMIRIGLEPKKV